MKPTGEKDAAGRPMYACRNDGCDARGFLPNGKDAATWAMHGYGDFCGRPNAMHGPRLLGFGDRVEQVLSFFGITQERYVALKVRLGGSDACNCPARREWLNGIAWLNNIASAEWWMGLSRRTWSFIGDIIRALPPYPPSEAR